MTILHERTTQSLSHIPDMKSLPTGLLARTTSAVHSAMPRDRDRLSDATFRSIGPH